ncbi:MULTISPECIES: Tat pathway signal protein [unclassified Actinomyces]|uniref:Tat pathway signal protein n=1 Tax=unclassified Actinomyces TaxID=2609248 RepID=UPI002017A309|nr:MULTISPECIES: Tat pathway signal protein [unclassified Actinomyces]MCL3776925.1 Tat pathway signal protein [Actinomyces sp. AC-20-1]MCL3789162.1 Tat pathway signal protein [Actinomyces sp. 187325]MCL3792456.1 Tat pathway signal protein [Actinomyces sp. 186855]MCL3794233.1 Tat pathway signal protein [Actinomyces sp. 217892]
MLQGAPVLLRLLTRQRRTSAALWLLMLWSLVAVAPPSYERTYPDAASRQAVIDLADSSPAMGVFMGRLPSPGSLGQVFAWETGTYVLWCAALLAVVLTASATRGDEESGMVELARGSGAGRWTPLVSSSAWVAALLTVLSAGTGLLLTVAAMTSEEMTVAGAWVYSALLLVVGLVFEALTLVLAQLLREPTAVRGVGLMGFAVAFALRVTADTTGASWLRWLTPLAWRDLIDPYGANDVGVLVVGLGVALAAGGLAALLHHHRDTGAAWLPEPTRSRRRRRVRGPLDLLLRLGARSTGWWLVSLVVLTGLFTGMGAAMTDVLDVAPQAAATLAALTGPGSIAATYLLLVAEFTVLLIAVAVVLRTLGAVGDERDGLTEAVLAQGVSRSRWYWARVADAAVLAAVALVVTAGATAAVAGSQFPGEQAAERAWVYTLSQGAGMLAVLGVAFCLVGLAPRLAAGVSWAVVSWSAFTVFLAGLLGLPRWLLDVSALGHVVEVGAPTAWTPLVVQGAVGVLGLLAGWWGLRRRAVPGV